MTGMVRLLPDTHSGAIRESGREYGSQFSRDPGENRLLIVGIRHSFGHALPLEFPLASKVDLRFALHKRPLVRAVQQSRLALGRPKSGLTARLRSRSGS